MTKIGFIGVGVMGGALARAVRKKTEGDDLLLSNGPESVSEALAAELGCVAADNKKVAEECKYIFLAVKPNVIRSVIAEIAPTLKQPVQSAAEQNCTKSEQTSRRGDQKPQCPKQKGCERI